MILVAVMKKHQKGLSLIELSIALIIIGFIIIGTFQASSLIESAKARTVIAEYNSYTTAINAYYARFNNLPGDDPRGMTLEGDALPGNGNGRIEYGDIQLGKNSSNWDHDGDYEGLNAWQHLKHAKIIEGDFKKGTVIPKSGEHIPQSKLSNNAGWIFDFVDETTQAFLCSPKGSTWNQNSNRFATAYKEAVISPNMAKRIDTKIDNSYPKTGRVRGYDGYALDEGVCINTTIGQYQEDAIAMCSMGFLISI